jgi:hypothetical protein
MGIFIPLKMGKIRPLLTALTFRDVFRAGADYYGVSDLEAMRKETHKFESRYLDRLIGPYHECRDLYKKRSPINFVDNLSCPVIFFQGLEDKIVPHDQTEKMFNALSRKGVPVSYLPFGGSSMDSDVPRISNEPLTQNYISTRRFSRSDSPIR